jgi:predicted AAA+ superfamily ATPase
MRLSVEPFRRDDNLAMGGEWMRNVDRRCTLDKAAREAALQWALLRGSRSGRVAHQFALDWAGRSGLARQSNPDGG